MQTIVESVSSRAPEVAEVKSACSALLGGGDSATTDSLHKRLGKLNERFGQLQHSSDERSKDLDELDKKLEDFEKKSQELSQWIESTIEKIGDDDISRASETEMSSLEKKLKVRCSGY